MSDDEKLQIKKDTLWDVHEAKREVACLERKVETVIDSMKEVTAAWDANLLATASSGTLMRKKTGADFGTVSGQGLKEFPASSELAALVDQLGRAKKKHESLQRSFDRM